MVVSYSGELEVDGGEFILNADRFIVRDREISFKLSGSDDVDGAFSIEGTATLTSLRNYVASEIEYSYIIYPKNMDKATIHFDVINQSNKKLRCKIEGKWIQGDTWKFSGNLRKFKEGQHS